ncbi:DUF6261 family protein [Flaviaesturariibacter aridisoli]|uniref:Uncharacterized protein n=1 Tax=Flaviaesturariibacter aridisoli TaxID=2545761 RepID=A0A4R4DVQ7_9BACT|nr:DUF6261 family protein [Flaviaesturariibacter aridisoli]TCZ67731.1 hypothetical protein E0486_15330 [Flaviaesturariibacter aridisoli]
MVTTLYFQHLQNAESVLYAERLIERIISNDPLPPPVQRAKDDFTRITSERNVLVQRALGSRYTDDLANGDARRDELTTSLFWLCEGFARCEHDGRRAAAALLLEALKPYSTAAELTKFDGDKETKLIENLVRDLRARADLRDALQTLGLDSLLTALEAANLEFKRLMEAQSDDELTKPEANRMVVLRRDSARAYRELMKQIDSAYNYTGGAEPWLGMVAALNQITEEFMHKLAQRQGRAAAQAETTQP